jgi:hypothetical protein
MYVPVSTALMTVYSDEYFGVAEKTGDSSKETAGGGDA